jgi:hypothetical protein
MLWILAMFRNCTIIGVVVLAAFSRPAAAYDTLAADFAMCTNGNSTQAKQIVAACSRLIANAEAEGEITGMFYVMRGATNTDKAANCRDAGKALTLIKAPQLIAVTKGLVASNCLATPQRCCAPP